MKRILSFWLGLFFSTVALAQGIEATYEVTTVRWAGEPHEEVFEYSWKVYYKGNKVASYFIPKYVDKYPDGHVRKQIQPHHSLTTQLPTAEKLDYEVFHLDSMVRWNITSGPFTNDQDPCAGQKDARKISKESARFWTFYDETKNVEGLNCQRASAKFWDGWFATDIEVGGSTYGLYTVPFLLVEGTQHGTNKSFRLLSVDLNAQIDDSVFWPVCFQERFNL